MYRFYLHQVILYSHFFAELLPSPPTLLQVEALTDKSVRVVWSWPNENMDTVTQYLINITALRHFDEHPSDIDSTGTRPTGEILWKYVSFKARIC